MNKRRVKVRYTVRIVRVIHLRHDIGKWRVLDAAERVAVIRSDAAQKAANSKK
jgi:hypothetical protein